MKPSSSLDQIILFFSNRPAALVVVEPRGLSSNITQKLGQMQVATSDPGAAGP
jgi:hypothetical protein